MQNKDKVKFIGIALLIFLTYYTAIQLYLVIGTTISAVQFDLEWTDSYEIIKSKVPIYRAMIAGYLLIIASFIACILSIRKRIKSSDYYQSSGYLLNYIKASISELGGILGALIFVLNIINISYGSISKADYYFSLDSKDLPHLLEAIPYLLTGYLFWTGFDLRRGKMKDYLTLTAFVIWVLLFIFSIFIIWFFSGSDYSHMP